MTRPNEREAVILAVLIHGSRYGREIRDEYEKRSDRKMPLGSLYTTLSRMERKGFLRSKYTTATEVRGGNRRRNFELTADGERAYQSYEDWVTTTFASSSGVAR